jgi:hypothetical protein
VLSQCCCDRKHGETAGESKYVASLPMCSVYSFIPIDLHRYKRCVTIFLESLKPFAHPMLGCDERLAKYAKVLTENIVFY